MKTDALLICLLNPVNPTPGDTHEISERLLFDSRPCASHRGVFCETSEI